MAIITVVMFSCLFLRMTICNSNYHKALFIRHNIGLNTYNYVNSTIDSIFEDVLSDSPDDFKSNLATTIKSSISLKFVSLNVENIRNDIFKYFYGEKEFLPDISFSDLGNSQGIEKLAQNITSSNFKTLKSVNLSTIFETFNLSQVSNILFVIKFIFFIIKTLPTYLLLIMLFLLFCSIVLTDDSSLIKLMLKCYMSLCFVSFILLGILTICIPHFLLNKHMFLPPNFDKNITMLFYNYTKDLFLPLAIMFFAFSLLSITVLFVSKKSLLFFNKLSNFNIFDKLSSYYSIFFYSIASLILIVCISYKTSIIKTSIELNNFDNLISSQKVVIAKNDTLYAVQILVLDAKTKMPIPDIAISMTGISNDGSYYNNMARTNLDGTLSFEASKGHFHIDFVSDLFPPEYVLPKRSHVTFDTARTVILPFNLKYVKNNSSKENLGCVSITMLDSSNMPYPNIKLCFTPKDNPSKKEYVIANSDGVAVFRGPAAQYTVSTCKSKFPTSQYYIPNSFDIDLENGTSSSYTIKLVSK